jgi:hypothetical protein
MFSFLQRFCIASLLLIASATASAQWLAGMVYDPQFGANVPQLDMSSEVLPIGFVELPKSGGYLFFTAQVLSGNVRIVETRFRDDGTLDTAWATTGPYAAQASLLTVLPAPDFDSVSESFKARVAVDIDATAGTEKIYFMELIADGGVLAVTEFGSDGTELSSNIISSTAFFEGSVASIEAIATGVSLGTSSIGTLVALQGSGAESSSSALIGVSGNVPTTPLSLDVRYVMTNPLLRINFMAGRADGAVDIAGTEDKKALYALVDAAAKVLQVENDFDLACPSGSPAASVLDGMARIPPASDDSTVIVTGRVDCGMTGKLSEVARVANITLPISSTVLSASFPEVLPNCDMDFDTAGCESSFLTVPSAAPDTALMLTPGLNLMHVDISGTNANVAGEEANSAASGAPLFVPSFNFGFSLRYPYLVGLSVDAHENLGIRRIAIDRIFADGAGDFGL